MSMALTNLSYSMPANFIQASYLPTKAWGSANIGGTVRLPAVAQVDFGLWSGTGSQVGLGDELLLDSGTLTSTTPGTTDIKDIDLQTALDVSGVAASIDEVVHLCLLVDSTTDAVRLVIEGNATNGWTAPFRDMVDPTLGKLSVPAGFVNPTSSASVPGGIVLWGGNLSSMPVTGTNKVLRIRLVAGTTANYRVILLGRSAAS
jgi:hypothetical protein